MNRFVELAELVMARCDELGAVSQSDTYVDRRYLTAEHKAANELVASWMSAANMQTWQDAAGNLWGRYKSTHPQAKSLLLGSHLDTVINGGKYDGMLGVVCPIAVIQMFHDNNIQFPFHIDLVGFADEEGTRFGSTLLGSRALTGQWQPEWANLLDADGVSLRQAMLNFGLDFDQVESCKITPESLIAYVELHIEQGPVLEQQNLPVGVVSAIAGAKRLQVELIGMAGHAGTVPMNKRQDTLAGASEITLVVEAVAQQHNVVATVGQITNKPNAVNVISGYTTFSLDIRSEDDKHRDEALTIILQAMQEIASRRGLTLGHVETHQAPAVKCSNVLIESLSKAVDSTSTKPFVLLSGAGHDAMALADICPVGMLFTRCEKGISHNPKEAIATPDVEVSLETLYHFIEQFDPELNYK